MHLTDATELRHWLESRRVLHVAENLDVTQAAVHQLTLVLLTTFPLLTRPCRASVPVRVIVPERNQLYVQVTDKGTGAKEIYNR